MLTRINCTFFSLPAVYPLSSLSTQTGQLVTCLLPIAYCLLPIAYCLLPIAYCLGQKRSRVRLPGRGGFLRLFCTWKRNNDAHLRNANEKK
jgi:hypothetical protein